MKLINELIMKFEQPKYITILCLIVALIVFIITYINPITQKDNILYFLSSISQGLAAIFTLVFTITIFGVQMMKRYTSMSKIFDRWTILLMIIFGIGIIFPLIQLVVNHNYLPFDRIANLSLALDLFLATFCVLSIIPYSIRVNRIMKYEGGIFNLAEGASEAIDSGHKVTASNKVSELMELGKNSVYEMQWDKAYTIVEKLEFLGTEIVDKEWTDLGFSTISGIEEIGSKSWYKDIKLTVRAIIGLKAIGLKSVEKKLDGVPFYFGRSSYDLGTRHFIDFYETSSNLDYDSVCTILGIDSPKNSLFRIMDFFNILNFQDEFLRASLYTDLGKYPKNLEYINIIGTHNKIINESYLKEFELYGIKRFSSLPQKIMTELKEIGMKASVESQSAHGFAVASSALSGLKTIGISAIDNDLSDGTVSMSSYCMYEIGKASVKESLDIVNEVQKIFMILDYVVKSLETIANKAYIKDKNKFKNSYESSLGFLWVLGAYSNRYLPKYAEDMASELKKSNNRVIKDTFGSEDIRKDVREFLKNSEVIKELKAFEEIYDKIR